MGLKQIQIDGFRNILSGHLGDFSKLNVVHGRNGSGKTSFLEAIYLAGMGQSFRTPNINKLINRDREWFRVVAQFQPDSQPVVNVGIERDRKKTVIKMGGKYLQRKSDLVRLLPIQLINPDSHHIMELGPKFRRQVIDWGVFHVEPQYLNILKNYMQHLKQRNSLVRRGAADAEIKAWTKGLVLAAAVLHRERMKFISLLDTTFRDTCHAFLDLPDLSLVYSRGWPEKDSYDDILARSLKSDRERGFTQYGPHRCDLTIKSNQSNVKEIVSRGQQKLLICALKIAQLKVIKQKTASQAVLLVDDLPAELDIDNRKILIRYISELPFQSFITTTDPKSLEGFCEQPRMFHVEQGAFSAQV